MSAVGESRREQILELLTEGDPDTPLVQRVCEVSAALLGVSGAGMCLVGGRSHQIVVHGTTVLAEELEDLQVVLGQGPCMQAVRTGSPTLVPDLTTHQTVSWPVFAKQALARGVRALFAFPLESGITTLGALDLYRDTPGPLTGAELIDALILTGLAAQAMAAQKDRVYVDGSVSALHWVATGHPAHGEEPAGTPRPGGDPVTRGRAVDLGITVGQALSPTRPDGGNDPIGDRPGPDRLGTESVTLAAHPLPSGSVGEPRAVIGSAVLTESRLVLVVGDEPGLRLVLGRALARAGYRVLLAASAADATVQLRAHPELAAVIADITLSTETGGDFAAAVVAHHPALPILFLTGGATATGALDDPLIGLVQKPVGMGELFGHLGNLIDQSTKLNVPTDVPPTVGTPSGFSEGPRVGDPARRVEPGGRLGRMPELDQTTTSWAATVGITGVSAVPGAEQSTGLANLGLFAAGVANEVNNMLAVVAMRADLIADGEPGSPPSANLTDDVTAITAATTRASALVQQLMLFAGQRTLDRGLVDVAELVADLQHRFDEVAGGPGIVSCQIEPVPAVVGDHEHLERVLLNLVTNALQAGAPPPRADPLRAGVDPSTGPRVWVRVEPVMGRTDDGGLFRDGSGRTAGQPAAVVVMEVTDVGRGMAPAVRDRALEPFFRGSSSGGSGLGLAIAHGIITQHGGRLDIDSAPGHGTTVRVTLPVDRVMRPCARTGCREEQPHPDVLDAIEARLIDRFVANDRIMLRACSGGCSRQAAVLLVVD